VNPTVPDCDYCGESFDAEAARDDHLRETHRGELGRIDRRRLGLDADDADESGSSVGVLLLGAVLAIGVVAVAVTTFVTGGGGGAGGAGEGPTNVGGVHYHGTVDVVIDGEAVDFSEPRYQYRTTGEDAFHFEGGDGSEWHGHAEGVTLAFAMDSVGIEVTETTVTFNGTTYDDADADTNVTVAVDGDPVTPDEYVLEDGDHIRIVVDRS